MLSLGILLAVQQSPVLPPDLAETTRFLMGCGMADSSGCELRWVTLDNGIYQEETVAWIPVRPEDRDGFGVANNGLKYPISSVGKPATFAEIEEWRQTPQHSGRDFTGTAPIRSTSTFMALALRAGQIKMAEEIASQYPQSKSARPALVSNFLHSLQNRCHYLFAWGDFEQAKELSDHFVNNLNAFQTWSRFDDELHSRQVSVREQNSALIEVNRDASGDCVRAGRSHLIWKPTAGCLRNSRLPA